MDGTRATADERLHEAYAKICQYSPVHLTRTGKRVDPCSKKRESRSPLGSLVIGPRQAKPRRGGAKFLPPLEVFDRPICASPGCEYFAGVVWEHLDTPAAIDSIPDWDWEYDCGKAYQSEQCYEDPDWGGHCCHACYEVCFEIPTMHMHDRTCMHKLVGPQAYDDYQPPLLSSSGCEPADNLCLYRSGPGTAQQMRGAGEYETTSALETRAESASITVCRDPDANPLNADGDFELWRC